MNDQPFCSLLSAILLVYDGKRAGEMAQMLRALADLSEDPASVLRAVHRHL